MKKMTRRRITALFMAVLMIVGILPLSMLTGIFSSKAQARTVTASIDLSKGLKAGTVYGDESIVKLEVLIDMPVKEGSGATVEGGGKVCAGGDLGGQPAGNHCGGQ